MSLADTGVECTACGHRRGRHSNFPIQEGCRARGCKCPAFTLKVINKPPFGQRVAQGVLFQVKDHWEVDILGPTEETVTGSEWLEEHPTPGAALDWFVKWANDRGLKVVVSGTSFTATRPPGYQPEQPGSEGEGIM